MSIAAGEVTTRTLTSDVGAHPRYSGSQEGGGERGTKSATTRTLTGTTTMSSDSSASRTRFSSFGQAKPSYNSRRVSVAPGIVRDHRRGREHGQADGSANCGEGEGTLLPETLVSAANSADGLPERP